MIFLIGSALVIFACGFAGNLLAQRLKQRRLMLLGMEQGLQTLIREIGDLATPLPIALRRAGELAGSAAGLFLRTVTLLQQLDGCTGQEAWLAALEQEAVQWNPNERAALTTVAAGLGSSSRETQLQQLSASRARILACEEQAAEQEQRFGKLWRSMGWACGIVLVLLLV